MAAVDKFTIEIIGEGGHGAYPHLGKDAVAIASQVINALQILVSRFTDPVQPLVLTIGTINGGSRFNVLCGTVSMTGTVRTLDEKLHRSMPSRIRKIVSSVTAAFGARYTFTYEVLGYPLRNSPRVLQLCKAAAEETLGRRRVVLLEKPSMGGEDFAEYLRLVPGCFIYIGAACDTVYPWHHERFDIDEEVLPQGAEVMAGIAKKYLQGA